MPQRTVHRLRVAGLIVVAGLLLVGAAAGLNTLPRSRDTDRAAGSCERRWLRYGDWLAQGNPFAAQSLLDEFGIGARLDPSNAADRESFVDACIPIRAAQLTGY